MAELSARDQAVLEFERFTWKYPAARESAIRDQFGISETRYAQILNHLLDQPAAMAYDALTVKRLRRLRDARRSARSPRRTG